MKRRYCIFALALSGLLSTSCRKEPGNPDWDVDVLAPILKTDLGFNDLLADSLLQVNPDNSLTLVYDNNVYGLTMDSLVSIPDTTVKDQYHLTFGSLNLNPGDQIVNAPTNTQYSLPNGIQLTKVILREGKMNVQLKNYVREKIKLTYTIPSAMNSMQQQFQVVEFVPGRVGNTPGILNKTYDLAGYTIDMRGQQGNSFNTMVTNMLAIVDPAAADSVSIWPPDTILVSNSFTGVIPQYAKGYFGQGSFSTSGTSDFSMFRHVTDGTLKLDSVKINLQVENSVGADARVKINSLSSINTRTNNTISLNHPVIGSTININRAFDNNGSAVASLYSVQLDNSNCNIKQLIENLPDKIGYDVMADINPLGNVSGGNDFIYYGGGVRVNMDMEIPLWFASDRLTLADTMDYAISADNRNIKSGTLSLFADNGFPFEASVQLYIMNTNNTILDSIMPPANTIDEGVVDANYIVTAPRSTRIDVPVNESKMNLLYDNRRIMIKVKLNTYGYPNYVKIYDSYKISLKLVGDFNYHVALH